MTNRHESGPVDPAAQQYLNAAQGVPQYGQSPYGPPQYQVPVPSAQPKKKRKWPWVLGGLVVLIVVIAVASGGGGGAKKDTASSGPAGANTNAPAAPAENVKGLNTSVRDGKLEFVVTGVQPGVSSVGDNPYLTQQAQGQFVIVSMTVKNTSDTPHGFSPDDQKLFDTQGRSFGSDTNAQIASGDNDIAVWDNINPGNTVQVKVIYDMPKDSTPARIELHDSAFSDGAKVSLK